MESWAHPNVYMYTVYALLNLKYSRIANVMRQANYNLIYFSTCELGEYTFEDINQAVF